MPSPSKVFMKCSSCKDIWLLPVGQQVCNRCLLHQERGRAERAERAYTDLERSFASAARTMDADWRLHHLGWRRIATTLASELEEAERERDEVKEESKVLRRQRESYKKERDELREALKGLGGGEMTFEKLQQQIDFDISDRLYNIMHSCSERHLDPPWIHQKDYHLHKQRKITWLCEGFSIDLTIKPKPR